MIFLNTYLQPLSIYSGGTIVFNYLYERRDMAIYNVHKDHLFCLCYQSKKEYSVLLHVSVAAFKVESISYKISLYEIDEEKISLFKEPEDVIKKTIENFIPVWTTVASNHFLFFFQLRELSHKIGRRVANGSRVDKSLDKFDAYKKSHIDKLENGFRMILDYVCHKTDLTSDDLCRDFLTLYPMVRHEVTKLEDWYCVWQLYRYQQDHTGWHEAIKWLRLEVQQYRKRELIGNLIQGVLYDKIK